MQKCKWKQEKSRNILQYFGGKPQGEHNKRWRVDKIGKQCVKDDVTTSCWYLADSCWCKADWRIATSCWHITNNWWCSTASCWKITTSCWYITTGCCRYITTSWWHLATNGISTIVRDAWDMDWEWCFMDSEWCVTDSRLQWIPGFCGWERERDRKSWNTRGTRNPEGDCLFLLESPDSKFIHRGWNFIRSILYLLCLVLEAEYNIFCISINNNA